MTKLEFAVFDEGGYNWFTGDQKPVDVYETILDEAKLEESLGFDYHFLIEHQGHAVGQIQTPAVLLAAIARSTSRIRIGSMVFLLPFHNPLRLAMDCAMVDQLSRGRLEFGAGVGGSPDSFAAWNIPFAVADRRKAGAEALTVIEKAWTSDRFTFHGNFYKYDQAIALPRPYQDPHPRIWFAGRTRGSLDFAAERNYGVGMFLIPDDDIANALNYWRSAWDRCGHKTPRAPAFLTRAVLVADSDEEALHEASKYLHFAYSWGEEKFPIVRIGSREFYSDKEVDTPDKQLAAKMFTGMRTGIDFWLKYNLAYVGSPSTVAKKIEEAREKMGFDVFGGRFRFGPIPDDMVKKSIRLFGEKVMPALR